MGALAVQALLSLVAMVGCGLRFRARRRRSRPLAVPRRDPDAVRGAPLRLHAAPLRPLRLAGRLPAPALVQRAAGGRLARDPLRRVRPRGRRGARPRRARDPRRPRAVPLRRLDAREHARERRLARDDPPAAQGRGRGGPAGGALRGPGALVRRRHGAVRLGPAPLRRLPDRRRRSSRSTSRSRTGSGSRPTSRSRSSASSRKGSPTRASTRAPGGPRCGSRSASASAS